MERRVCKPAQRAPAQRALCAVPVAAGLRPAVEPGILPRGFRRPTGEKASELELPLTFAGRRDAAPYGRGTPTATLCEKQFRLALFGMRQYSY
jgi:hypothetical protein